MTRKVIASESVPYRTGVTSKASIGGHPLHPMIIPFPIAFLSGALLTDILYWYNNNPFWAEASFWLLVGGVVTGALAAILGLIDFMGIERMGNLLIVGIALVNLFLRWDDPESAIVWWGLLLSLVTGGLLVVTGWYGGELAYRHRVGVIEDDD
jgi:uncharacterized membrane protein